MLGTFAFHTLGCQVFFNWSKVLPWIGGTIRVTRFEFVKKRTLRRGKKFTCRCHVLLQLVEAARCSVARLEMAYCIKGSKSSYLDDNYHLWHHWKGGRPMTVLSTVRARKKVERKGDTLSKTCKDVITSL